MIKASVPLNETQISHAKTIQIAKSKRFRTELLHMSSQITC